MLENLAALAMTPASRFAVSPSPVTCLQSSIFPDLQDHVIPRAQRGPLSAPETMQRQKDSMSPSALMSCSLSAAVQVIIL